MTDHPRPLTIAVVDDDPGIVRALESLLESADHAVRPFASATALLESGCLGEIDCLISDIGMPGMDGCELLRRVQAEQPELPIILVTGHPEMLDRSPMAICPARVFKKPFDAQALLMALADALRGPRLRKPQS
jgi:FixJ family two-component response regulator